MDWPLSANHADYAFGSEYAEEDAFLIEKARGIAEDCGRRLRAAAFTSWASEEERSRALVAGFDLFINKPVHPLALISAITTLSR